MRRLIPYGYVCAAGEYVQGYDIGNSVEYWRGTSMAAPFVTAEAAILLSVNDSLSDEALAYLISSTCHTRIPELDYRVVL